MGRKEAETVFEPVPLPVLETMETMLSILSIGKEIPLSPTPLIDGLSSLSLSETAVGPVSMAVLETMEAMLSSLSLFLREDLSSFVDSPEAQ